MGRQLDPGRQCLGEVVLRCLADMEIVEVGRGDKQIVECCDTAFFLNIRKGYERAIYFRSPDSRSNCSRQCAVIANAHSSLHEHI